MNRMVLYVHDIRQLLGYGRSRAYQELSLIRQEYPTSGNLASGRVLLKDFAHRHGYTPGEVSALLRPVEK